MSPDLYEHFQSSLRYSTQALPLNTLLDTLLRPNADTEISPESLVEWRRDPERAVSHVVLGDAPRAGGQWAENPVSASWGIGTLSYSEMLSLPGYSYEQHYHREHNKPMPELIRPSRTEVADYYAAYPGVVGISDAVRNSTRVQSIRRISHGGFEISTGISAIRCRHLVLATGIFTSALPPPPSLSSIARLDDQSLPLLVVGSGFSAADVIISNPPQRQIIHVFKWNPEERPSPLKGCHHQAYPEYAGIYRQMKLAALAAHGGKTGSQAVSPSYTRKRNPFFNQRDWANVYEGLPNAQVVDARLGGDGVPVVRLQGATGEALERRVGGLAYVVGRRGDLDYLDNELRHEVLSGTSTTSQGYSSSCPRGTVISGKTLRAQAEVDLEVANGVFIIGSLTGDSLVRHAFGGCVYVAGRIMGEATSGSSTPVVKAADVEVRHNGIAHEDLHLDRRKLVATQNT